MLSEFPNPYNIMVDHMLSLVKKSVQRESFVAGVADKLGVKSPLIKKGITLALPFILGGMAKNAQKDGAQSISKALSKKHDGSILDNFSDLIARPEEGEGAGILKHILGSKEAALERFVGQETEMSESQSKGLIQMLAPMVMGAVGKEAKDQNLDPAHLGQELEEVSETVKDSSPLDNMMVKMFLDRDGDGDVDAGDLLKAGMSFLK